MIDAIEDLLRTSLDDRIVPTSLKDTWTTPIWKGSDKEEPLDYRPIAITSHLVKVMERIVRKVLADHLIVNKWLDNGAWSKGWEVHHDPVA